MRRPHFLPIALVAFCVCIPGRIARGAKPSKLIPQVRNFYCAELGEDFGSCIAQDEIGNLVITPLSDNGVVIYDGSHWTTIKTEYHVYDLQADSNGRVWLATTVGISYLERDTQGNYQIRDVNVDIPGDMHQGFFIASSREKDIAFLNSRVRVLCESDSKPIVQTFDDSVSIVGQDERHLYLWEESTDQLHYVDDRGNIVKTMDIGNREIKFAQEISNGKLLLTHSNGVEVHENDSFRPFSRELNQIIAGGREAFCMIETAGGLGIGFQGAFMLFNLDGSLRYRLGEDEGIPDTLIVRMMTDRQGNLWLAHEQGLTCLFQSLAAKRFSSLAGDVGGCFEIEATHDRLLLFGPTQLTAVSNLGKPEQSHVTHELVHAELIPHPSQTLIYDRHGIYELSAEKLSPIIRTEVLSAAAHPNNVIAYAEFDGQVKVGRLNGHSIEHYQSVYFPMPIYALRFDRNLLWVEGEQSVLACVEFESEDWRKKPKVHELAEDLGEFWTQRLGEVGLVRDQKQVRTFELSDGSEILLRSAPRFALLDVEIDDVLEMGPNESLLRCRSSVLTIHDKNPVGQYEPEPRTLFRLPDWVNDVHFDRELNRLIVATGGDIFCLDPATSPPSQLPPPNIQTSFPRSLHKQSFIFPAETTIHFRYSVPYFDVADYVEYRHRLVGLQEGFTPWTDDTEVEFQRIPAGTYQLEVEARAKGMNQSQFTSQQFTIRPHWYRTWWANLGFLIGLIGLIGVAVRFRNRQLNAAQKRLAMIVDQQTSKLRSQAELLAEANTELVEKIHDLEQSQTRQAQLEDRLQEAKHLESLGQLAGGVAHDFNNLLTVMFANLEMMEGLESNQEVCRDQVLKASEKAAGLCRQLLMVSGSGNIDTEPLDLNDLVMELRWLLETLTEGTDIQIEFELAADSPLVIQADRTQISQLILNLVTNAVEACRRQNGKAIQIRTQLVCCQHSDFVAMRWLNEVPNPGDYVCLTVQDDGGGVDANSMHRIFDPFFSTKAVGRGLGLATVLRVASRHQGAVRVESLSGTGTTMSALLPVSKSKPTQRSNPTESTQQTLRDTGTVLLVDDDHLLRESIAKLIRTLGHDCVSFDSGQSALEYLRDRDVDVAVIDLSMPRMSGPELIDRLQDIAPQTEIIAISGYAKEYALQTDPDRVSFLGKPFTHQQLAESIENKLKGKTTVS